MGLLVVVAVFWIITAVIVGEILWGLLVSWPVLLSVVVLIVLLIVAVVITAVLLGFVTVIVA